MPANRANATGATRPKQPQGVRPATGAARTPPNPGFQIVGIGASAGGLEACTAFLDALPAHSSMAFILVQHLDPTHDSLMVELLATHTSLAVLQATDGAAVEPGHFYIIPPAFFLTLADGSLHLRPAPAMRGARLPFDALLLSMAEDCGARATCIVLSGTGADGSEGLLAIKRQGGFVIAQDPAEAGYDGMPSSAIATGAVDAVLPVAAMPAMLAQRASQPASAIEVSSRAAGSSARDHRAVAHAHQP
jgi:two-component system CheB/CheR fusion protein